MENSLPNNWVETELGNYIYLKNGYAYKSAQFRTEGIPILKISNITKDGKISLSNIQFIDKKDFTKNFLINKGDILIAMSGATTGKFGIYEEEDLILQNQRVGNLKLYSENLGNKKFVYYLLGFLKKEIEDRAYGGAQPNISSTLIETIKIPLPPLPEQERIVAKLDVLFAQHEAMKKALERIPQLLKDFRQQVLKAAITGGLTKKWREEKIEEDIEILYQKNIDRLSLLKKWKKIEKESTNYIDVPENWKKTFIGNISIVSNGATPSRKIQQYWGGEIPWIGSGFIQNNRINYSNEFITEEGLKNSSVKKLPIGTVLMAMIGEGKTRAQSSILDIEATINQNIAAIEIDNEFVLSEFLQYYLIYNYKKHRIVGNGTGPQALNCEKVRELEFILPPIKEQQEIVLQVENLFAKANSIEKRYKNLKEKIDSLPQAILHKAFKGELVPQQPTDGDAKDLLEEILKLKKEVKKK